MNVARKKRDEMRENNLSVPMTLAEKESVRSAANREGMTQTAYTRKVLSAASKLSLSQLIILVEREKNKEV